MANKKKGNTNFSNWRHSSIGRGRRKIAFRDPRRTIRIVVEGEKTEKIYFNEIRKDADLSAMEVRVIHCTKGTSATQIVNEGIKILTQHDPNIDEVWCVFDQESQNEKNDYERALKIKNGIQLPDHKKFFCAISNPCFEFWILLHIEKTDMPFNNCSEVYKYIKTKIPLYTKSNNLEIRKLCSLASTAVFNSYWLRERKLSCPATNVDKLMMALSKSRFGNTTND